MQIDWILGLVGGAMIGLAGAAYLLLNGRIMGASGIIGGIADGSAGPQTSERLWFLAGLFAVPAMIALLSGGASTHVTDNLWALIGGGLMVGIGTRLANGCTSGHGVCGISRLSVRGIIATLVYIVAGLLSVYVFRHMLGWV